MFLLFIYFFKFYFFIFFFNFYFVFFISFFLILSFYVFNLNKIKPFFVFSGGLGGGGGAETKTVCLLRNEMHHRGFAKLIHQLIVGEFGTSSICSPRAICEILPRFYHMFAEKSTSYLQLSDFILLSI